MIPGTDNVEKYPSNAQGQGTASDGIDWHITSDLPVKVGARSQTLF